MLTEILATMWAPVHVERFGELVRARLNELDRGQDLRFYGGPSDNTVRKILAGNVDVHRSTLRKLDEALEWERGSSEQVLDGGEPKPKGRSSTTPPQPPMSAAETADLEAGVQKLMSVQAGLMQRGQWDLAATLGEVIQTATQVGRELSKLNAPTST